VSDCGANYFGLLGRDEGHSVLGFKGGENGEILVAALPAEIANGVQLLLCAAIVLCYHMNCVLVCCNYIRLGR